MDAPIFISFAHDDRKAAETICTALEQRGLKCWIATRNIAPGDNFQEAITRAIRAAKTMLLVFSGHANNSIEVKKEIALASRYNVIVVPVRVEDVVPNDALTYELAVRQWIDMFDDWERAIERLVIHLKSTAEADAAATPAMSPVGPAAPQSPTAVQPPIPAPAAQRRSLLPILIGIIVIVAIAAGALAWHLMPPSQSTTAAQSGPPPAAPPPAPSLAAPPATPAAPPPAAPVPPQPADATPPSAAAPPGAPQAPAEVAPRPTPAPAAAAAPSEPAGNPKIFRDCPHCPEMVVIPAGSSQIGSTAAEAQRYGTPGDDAFHEQPQHAVTIAKPFAIGKFSITRGEFAAFARATNFQRRPGCARPVGGNWEIMPGAGWEEPGFRQTERDPVVCMNNLEIEAYLEWLRGQTGKAYRLPSEAEWEYAARGGTTTAFYWGDDPSLACAYENLGDQSFRTRYGGGNGLQCNDGYSDTAPVGSFKPNPFGLYDMLGNVHEPVADCWNPSYAGAPTDGSVWNIGECARHPTRKGAFGVTSPWAFRAAIRWQNINIVKRNRGGFRVALSLP